ncbi:MAG: hypothetical protein GY716_17545 [bacterium]|nr:hypothetical protein [bacterium]
MAGFARALALTATVVVCSLAFCVAVAGRGAGAHTKPSPPLTFDIEIQGDPVPAKVDCVVTLRVAPPSAEVEFELLLPPGVQRVRGPDEWSGPIDRIKRLEYTFSVPDEEEYAIYFLGRIYHDESDYESGAGVVKIDLGEPSDRRDKGRRTVDGHGNRLRLHEAK